MRTLSLNEVEDVNGGLVVALTVAGIMVASFLAGVAIGVSVGAANDADKQLMCKP